MRLLNEYLIPEDLKIDIGYLQCQVSSKEYLIEMPRLKIEMTENHLQNKTKSKN